MASQNLSFLAQNYKLSSDNLTYNFQALVLEFEPHSVKTFSFCSFLCYSKLFLWSVAIWRKVPQNSNNKPWAYICSKGFYGGLIFGGSIFMEGLIIGGNFVFQNGLDLTIKTA